MANQSLLSMQPVVDYLYQRANEVSRSSAGTRFQRERIIEFLEGLQRTTRAFCRSEDQECDYVPCPCPPMKVARKAKKPASARK